MRRDAKIDLIGRVQLFAGCSKKELGEIASLADELDLREGRTIIREGERGREFFVIVDGTVSVTRKGRKVASLAGGDFVGEIALISDVPRTATVVTTSPARVLVVTDRDFRGLVQRMPNIAVKVLAAVAERLKPQVA